ncbi:deoxyribonuclease gamma-like isoform X2 [Oncorhynchus nerka]
MVMFLGDFNADCGYVAKKNRQHVRLYSNQAFLWLIGDTEDTTVRQTTTCAYDRIVVHGAFEKAIVPQSAQPFNFAKEYGLTEEQALDVSDHYPVEVELKAGSEHLGGHTLLIILMAFFIST